MLCHVILLLRVNRVAPECAVTVVLLSVVSVCLCVCLFVNTITREPLEISPRNFQGIIERADKFENGYVEVRRW